MNVLIFVCADLDFPFSVNRNETIFFAKNCVRLDHVKLSNGYEIRDQTVIVNVVYITFMD